MCLVWRQTGPGVVFYIITHGLDGKEDRGGPGHFICGLGLFFFLLY